MGLSISRKVLSPTVVALLCVAAAPASARPGMSIIASVGPSSKEAQVLRGILEHPQVSGVRINMAHMKRPEAKQIGLNVDRTAAALGRKVTMLCDLPGGKLRTGPEPAGGSAALREGQTFSLAFGCRAQASTSSTATVDYRGLDRLAEVGGTIELHQGKIALQITRVTPSEIVTRVVRGGTLQGHATVNLVGKEPDFPSMTAQDRRKLKIAVESGATHIGVSMVQRPGQMDAVRRALGRLGARDVKLVAKIESLTALRQNLDGIVGRSDEVMIARGDLEMALRDELFVKLGREPSEVERKQAMRQAEKRIAAACQAQGKRFINATGFEGPDAKRELARARRLGSSWVLLKKTAMDPDPVSIVDRTVGYLGR